MIISRLLRNRRGSVAVEFAIMAQVFAVVLVGTSEIGIVYMKRQQLNNTLATATNYAMVNSSAVSASSGAALATTLAAILANDGIAAPPIVRIVVNNGPERSVTNNVATTAGNASDADRCYCPTRTTVVNWGPGVTCGSTCSSGLFAGKFVELRVQRAHVAVFAGYGGTVDGKISVMSLVQTE